MDFEQPSTSQEGNAVFITNLQWWTTDVDLEAVCSDYGQVVSIKFIEDRACGKSRGMAVVEFSTPQAAQACIDTMNGRDVDGRQCKVQRQMPQRQQMPPPMQHQNMMMMGGVGGGGRGGGGRGMGGRGRGGRGGGGGAPPNMMMDPGMMQQPPPPQWGGGGGYNR